MAHANDGSFLGNFLRQKGAEGQAQAQGQQAGGQQYAYAQGMQQQGVQQAMPAQGVPAPGMQQGAGQGVQGVQGVLRPAPGPWRPLQGQRAPAPPFATPPEDARARALVKATAQYVLVRRLDSKEFFRYVQLREEGGAARFAFLQPGGEGAAYFQWLLYCIRYGHPEGQRPPQEEAAGPRMPEGLVRKIDDLLNGLSGTKEAIRAGKERIVDEHVFARPIFAMVARRARELRDPKRALFQVYLANDVLVHCTKHRTDKTILDPVSEAVLEHAFPLLRAAYHAAPAAQQETVTNVVRLWGERGTFPEDVVRQLLEGMQAAQEPAQPVAAAAELMMDDELPPWLQPHAGDKRAGELDLDPRDAVRRRFD